MFETIVLPIALLLLGSGLGWVAKENNRIYQKYFLPPALILSFLALVGLFVWTIAVVTVYETLQPFLDVSKQDKAVEATRALQPRIPLYAGLFALSAVYLIFLTLIPKIRGHQNRQQPADHKADKRDEVTKTESAKKP